MAESWTTPKTWSYKEAPGSDSLNEQIRDNLKYVKESLPAGIIIGYGGAAAPSQWFLCDGTAVSRSTYAALFTAIGVLYGVGNGSTTFNLPDYRGRVMVGLSSTDADFDTLGKKYGAKTVDIDHTHIAPEHKHLASGDGGDLRAAIGRNNSSNDDIAFAHVTNANPNVGGATPLGASTAIDGSALSPGSISNFVPVYGYVGLAGEEATGTMSANDTPSIVQPGQVSNFIIKY